MDMVALKLTGSVGGAVIDKVIPFVQVFIMTQNQAFVTGFGQVPLYPPDFINPGGGIAPGRGR